MFRKPRFVIAAAAVFYVVALVVAWWQVTLRAEKRVDTMLVGAEEGFSAVVNGEIEAALRNVGGAFINLIGGKCVAVPIERMKELAATFNVDEINIVNREGIAIGSNLEAVLGFDYKSDATTREFMSLVESDNTMVSHGFRPGVANPDMVCAYYGLPFPEHDGFLQLGTTVDRLRQNMYSYTEAESEKILREWHFSVVGWYERAGMEKDFVPGKTIRRWSDTAGEMVIGRYFLYMGYRYVAYLPESYCYAQRNGAFAVTAAVLATLLTLFVCVLLRLTKASAKLERLHAEAERRTAEDLALAKKIQLSALPSPNNAFLDRLEFSFDAETQPAREVGGDFYDFYELADGRIAFLVADVSGKGIPGAMFMMETKNIIKSSLMDSTDLAEAVTKANRKICESNQAELFVTAWIGAVDPKSGVFEYVNAGHNRPFVRRANGEIEKVMGKGGKFLGMFEHENYRAHAIKLERGDLVYLYTDGVTEAMNPKGEQFGEKRLCEGLREKPFSIDVALKTFVADAPQSDDITGMMIYWNGLSPVQSRTFPVADSSLASAVEFVRGALSLVDKKPTAELLNAADEIVANIVSYSGAKEFRISVEKCRDRARLVFTDDGCVYNPLSHVDPDTSAPIEDRPIGGLGLVVVKRLVDRVQYARVDGRNELTLIKKFQWT